MGAESRSIDIRDNLAGQQRQWRAERIGWVLACFILGLTLLGVLGDGPLSDAVAEDPSDSLTVNYERISRRHSPTTVSLTIDLPPGAESIRIRISGAIAEDGRLVRINPPPESEATGPQGIDFTFATSPGAGEAVVTLTIEHTTIGKTTSVIESGEGARVEFTQWVLP